MHRKMIHSFDSDRSGFVNLLIKIGTSERVCESFLDWNYGAGRSVYRESLDFDLNFEASSQMSGFMIS